MFKACQSKVGGGAKRGSTVTAGDGGVIGSREKPFDTMNNIVANLLLNLTRSVSICKVEQQTSVLAEGCPYPCQQ